MPPQKRPNLTPKKQAPPTYEPKPEWLNGAEGFFNWCEDVKPRILTKGNRYTEFQPEPWQRQIITDVLSTDANGDFIHDLALLITPRRHGKTNIYALIVLWLSATRPNHTTQVLGNTEQHAERVQMKTLKGIIRHTPKLSELIPEPLIQRHMVKTVETWGSVIQMAAVNMSNAFGDKLNVLWVGDLHACPDTGPFDAYQAALLDSENTLCLIDSNPDSEDGHVHTLEKDAGEDEKTYCHRIEYRDFEHYRAEAPSWIDRHKAAKLQRTQLETAFKRDILGQRTSAVNALFQPEDIKACVSDFSMPVPPESLNDFFDGRKFVVGAGLDKAKAIRLTSNDRTVWTVVAKTPNADDGEPEYWVLNQVTWELGFDKRIKTQMTEDHKRYAPVGIALEAYETEQILLWGLDNNMPVETAQPTAQGQYKPFVTLHEVVKQGRLHFSRDCKHLEQEMRTFLVDESTKLPTFGHAKKCHDDHVYSLAWAIWSMRHKELAIYELPLFHCESKSHLQQFCYLRGGEVVLPCGQFCEGHYHCRQMYNQYKAVHPYTELTLPEFHAGKVKSKGGGPIVSIT